MNFHSDYKLVHEVEKEGKVLITMIGSNANLAVLWYDGESKDKLVNDNGSYPHGASDLKSHSYVQLTYNEAKNIHEILKEKMNDN